jgi:hypothetical protein
MKLRRVFVEQPLLNFVELWSCDCDVELQRSRRYVQQDIL